MVRRRPAKAQKAAETPPQKPEIEEETYFLNPDAVSPHLYCCICQEVFKEPWRAPCGHSFCKKCIFDWLSKSSICPSDRKPVTVTQLHHDFLVQSIIDDYVVACPWRALGCNNIGPLHQLKEHMKVCQLNPNNMPKVLQEYSVQVLSTAQQELQRKQVQRSLSTASTSRQSMPPERQSSASGTSLFDQLLSEELERDDAASSNVVGLPATTTSGEEVAAASSAAEGLVTTSANEGAAASSANSGIAASSLNGGGGAAASANSSFDDEEANLPGGQLPSLRMRLYMNSQPDGRSEFVNFLENLNTQPQLLKLPKSISRFCEPPDSKRPRLAEYDDED